MFQVQFTFFNQIRYYFFKKESTFKFLLFLLFLEPWFAYIGEEVQLARLKFIKEMLNNLDIQVEEKIEKYMIEYEEKKKKENGKEKENLSLERDQDESIEINESQIVKPKRIYNEKDEITKGWKMCWTTRVLELKKWPKTFAPGQKMNHFISVNVLSNKRNINRVLKLGLECFGAEHFGFIPETYELPMSESDLKELFARHSPWIEKEILGARGEGHNLVTSFEGMNNTSTFVLQKYIDPPHLVNNKKYHFRFFVLILSLSPVVCVVHNKGYLRFASKEYSSPSSDLSYEAHISNYLSDKSVSYYDDHFMTFEGFKDYLKDR